MLPVRALALTDSEPESAAAASSGWHWHTLPVPDQEVPGSPNRDPDSRFPADRETARFPIPDSRPPGRSGIGNRDIPPT